MSLWGANVVKCPSPHYIGIEGSSAGAASFRACRRATSTPGAGLGFKILDGESPLNLIEGTLYIKKKLIT